MTPFHKLEQNAKTNNAFMTRIRAVMHLKNDRALSKLLDVAPPVISKIRSGKLPIGATMVIAINEVTDLSVSQIKEMMVQS